MHDHKEIRVVVAESQTQVRFALRVLLERRHNMRIVGEAADSNSLLYQIAQTNPDLVLLSWYSPGLALDDLPRKVLDARPGVWLIVLSERQDIGPAALAAGAQAFVDKGNPPENLLTALDACSAAFVYQGICSNRTRRTDQS